MTKTEVARLEIERINQQIAALEQEKKLWEGVIEREASSVPSTWIPSAITVESEREYGSKTNGLRRHLVNNVGGVTFKELKRAAAQISPTTNFVYRFVDRLKETGEIEEREGKLFATQKMREKLLLGG